jgi:hypothetical protein
LLVIILGGVPVRVNRPPVLEPNATGNSIFDGNVPILQAEVIVRGIKVATVPVLLTNPESTPAPKVTITNNLGTLLPAHSTNFLPAIAVHPVCAIPSPIINSAAIIITVGLLNPLKVSVASRMPVRNKASIEISATMSGVNFPHIKRAIVIVRIMSIKRIMCVLFICESVIILNEVKLQGKLNRYYDESHKSP